MLEFIRFLYNRNVDKYLYDENNRFAIRWVNIEFCSSCNLNCRWCTLDHSKKKVAMSLKILERSLNELKNHKYFEIERLDLFNAGETLLHPDLKGMLEVVARAIAEFKKKPSVSLLTNATLLNKEKSRIILDSNALDEIKFSLDGGTPALYNEIRRWSNWDIVKKNVQNFLSENKTKEKPARTGVICMVPPEKPLSLEWMDDEFKSLFSQIDNVELRYPHNWDGSIDLHLERVDKVEPMGRICKFLLKNIVILPNGDVTVCCADLNSRGVIGNIMRSSLKNLIRSWKRLKMIYFFSKGEKNKIELCKNCNGYYE